MKKLSISGLFLIIYVSNSLYGLQWPLTGEIDNYRIPKDAYYIDLYLPARRPSGANPLQTTDFPYITPVQPWFDVSLAYATKDQSQVKVLHNIPVQVKKAEAPWYVVGKIDPGEFWELRSPNAQGSMPTKALMIFFKRSHLVHPFHTFFNKGELYIDDPSLPTQDRIASNSQQIMQKFLASLAEEPAPTIPAMIDSSKLPHDAYYVTIALPLTGRKHHVTPANPTFTATAITANRDKSSIQVTEVPITIPGLTESWDVEVNSHTWTLRQRYPDHIKQQRLSLELTTPSNIAIFLTHPKHASSDYFPRVPNDVSYLTDAFKKQINHISWYDRMRIAYQALRGKKGYIKLPYIWGSKYY